MTKRYAFGPFLLDAARGTLTRDGEALPVGQRGLRILQLLLQAAGEPVSKSDLLRLAWPGVVVEDGNLTVQITALRKLLGATPGSRGEWIATVPRVGYRVVETVAVEDMQLAQGELSIMEHGGRPSIAVLPFEHVGDDPAQEYLADGVTEALITALTRFRWFSVTGRNASRACKLSRLDGVSTATELGVRYLLTGSVRKSGERLRITAQLVEAASGRCLHAEHCEAEDADMFAVQDEIAQQVAAVIEPELLKEAGNLAARRRARSVTGWDLVAQGSWLFHHVTQPTHSKARVLFRQASRIDPDLVEAHLWTGRVNAGLVAYGWSDDPASDLREGRAAALQAVQLDERNPYAHYALAIVSTYLDDFDLALRSAEKATELSPCFALGRLVDGMASLYSGDLRRAVESLTWGLQLNCYDPQNFVWYNVLALARLFAGDAEGALQAAIAALKVRPSWRPAMRTAAAASAALGRSGAAAHWSRQWSEAPACADALQPLWRCNRAWVVAMGRLLDEAEGKGP